VPFEITDDGPALQLGAEIVAEASAAVAELIGADFDASDLTSVEGQIFSVLSGREVFLQGGMLDVLQALSVDNAQGRQLENLGSTQGLPRLGATFGEVALTINGTPAYDASNKLFKHLPTSTLWRSPAGSIIGGGGNVTVSAIAEEAVDVTVAVTASDFWVVVSVNPSITSCFNATEGTPGEPEEDLETYRARLKASTASGAGTEPAITAALLQVPGVTAETRVLVNRTLVVDPDTGVPPKSVEAIVVGGGDEAIVRALYTSASSVAGFAGTTTIAGGTYSGIDIDVSFTRPETIDLESEVELTSSDAEVDLPVDYVDQVEGALEGLAWKIGQNPTAARVYNAIAAVLPEDSYTAVTATFRLAGSGDAFVSSYAIGPRARAAIAAADVSVSAV
jgi:uncharacterized phage protein gp47/JayE